MQVISVEDIYSSSFIHILIFFFFDFLYFLTQYDVDT